jgi:hypothetical protein
VKDLDRYEPERCSKDHLLLLFSYWRVLFLARCTLSPPSSVEDLAILRLLRHLLVDLVHSDVSESSFQDQSERASFNSGPKRPVFRVMSEKVCARMNLRA